MSTALVGGINELVLSTLEEDGADRLDQLEETIVRFVESVLHHEEALAPTTGRGWRPCGGGAFARRHGACNCHT